jgi:hypothetical protein
LTKFVTRVECDAQPSRNDHHETNQNGGRSQHPEFFSNHRIHEVRVRGRDEIGSSTPKPGAEETTRGKRK